MSDHDPTAAGDVEARLRRAITARTNSVEPQQDGLAGGAGPNTIRIPGTPSTAAATRAATSSTAAAASTTLRRTGRSPIQRLATPDDGAGCTAIRLVTVDDITTGAG